MFPFLLCYALRSFVFSQENCDYAAAAVAVVLLLQEGHAVVDATTSMKEWRLWLRKESLSCRWRRRLPPSCLLKKAPSGL